MLFHCIGGVLLIKLATGSTVVMHTIFKGCTVLQCTVLVQHTQSSLILQYVLCQPKPRKVAMRLRSSRFLQGCMA